MKTDLAERIARKLVRTEKRQDAAFNLFIGSVFVNSVLGVDIRWKRRHVVTYIAAALRKAGVKGE